MVQKFEFERGVRGEGRKAGKLKEEKSQLQVSVKGDEKQKERSGKFDIRREIMEAF